MGGWRGYYIIIGCNNSIRQNNEENIRCDGIFIYLQDCLNEFKFKER